MNIANANNILDRHITRKLAKQFPPSYFISMTYEKLMDFLKALAPEFTDVLPDELLRELVPKGGDLKAWADALKEKPKKATEEVVRWLRFHQGVQKSKLINTLLDKARSQMGKKSYEKACELDTMGNATPAVCQWLKSDVLELFRLQLNIVKLHEHAAGTMDSRPPKKKKRKITQGGGQASGPFEPPTGNDKIVINVLGALYVMEWEALEKWSPRIAALLMSFLKESHEVVCDWKNIKHRRGIEKRCPLNWTHYQMRRLGWKLLSDDDKFDNKKRFHGLRHWVRPATDQFGELDIFFDGLQHLCDKSPEVVSCVEPFMGTPESRLVIYVGE